MYLQPSSATRNLSDAIPSYFALAILFSKDTRYSIETASHWSIEKVLSKSWVSSSNLDIAIRGYDDVLVGEKTGKMAIVVNYLPGDCQILLLLTVMDPFCLCQIKQVHDYENTIESDLRFPIDGFNKNPSSEDSMLHSYSTKDGQVQIKTIRAITRQKSDGRFDGDIVSVFELNLAAF
jgi:hypothetical protein